MGDRALAMKHVAFGALMFLLMLGALAAPLLLPGMGSVSEKTAHVGK